MRSFTRYIPSILIGVICLLSIFTRYYDFLVTSLTVLLVYMLLDRMGKGIVLRESTAILYVITCLVMPLVGYRYYSIENTLARSWFKYMSVPETRYFDFALPAITCFCFALTLPLRLKEGGDEGEQVTVYLQKMRDVLRTRKKIGVYIMIFGIFVGRIAGLLPGGLQFFANLFFFASFAGLLYIFYSENFRYKKLLMGGFLGFIIFNALGSGMFTIVAYMGITIYSFFLLGKPQSLLRKAMILILAFFFIIILQNTKIAYRNYTWRSAYTGNKAILFADLFVKNLQKGDVLMENRAFFIIYSRTNQGFNVALVMRRIPVFQPHDQGVNLLKALASAFVPRFLWPDKPEAGGKFNMKYYANIELRGWSTNIGPLGEAYGAFGAKGGVIYMLFLGAFIRWAYKKVFVISNRVPLLICWIPVVFYQVVYSGEADTLQILNSLFKAGLFMWILYKFLPGWFGKDKEKETEEVITQPALQNV